ncbi:uncharacterized protein [Ptychodera flava]|uniref:uncharacterized protein n=1 Tax=Ptychodera flava TaxID=63121 RepID=UPI00396A32B8
MNCNTLRRMILFAFCSFLVLVHIGFVDSSPVEIESNSGEEMTPSTTTASPLLHENGMLKLVLHDLSERLIKEMAKRKETMLTDEQMSIARYEIIGFYDEIKDHPALNTDRVMFSIRKPDFLPSMEPETDSSWYESGNEVTKAVNQLQKRKKDQPFQEVCRSTSEWRPLSQGINRSGERVRLYEKQYFHVTTCIDGQQPCRGVIDAYPSTCMAKPSWNIAYVWSEEDIQYKWDWISIDTCCTCRIQGMT